MPFKDESFVEIRAYHIFEHIKRFDRESILLEWWRLLKVGGFLKFKVPNMDRYFAQYAEGYWDFETLMLMIYNTQQHDGYVHYWGYNMESLPKYLKSVLGKSCRVADVSFGRRGQWAKGNVHDLELRVDLRKEA